jgi:hypothetical protein
VDVRKMWRWVSLKRSYKFQPIHACDNRRMAKKRPRDLNALAASIVRDATDPTPEAPDTRDRNAVALSKKGAAKGGRARAAKLSAERRKAIAQKAIAARWAKKR